MKYQKTSDLLLRFLLIASPLLYFPYADEPFRSFRETIFHVVMLGVIVFLLSYYIGNYLRVKPEGERAATGFMYDWLPTGITLFALSTLFVWLSLAVNGGGPLALKTAVNFTLGLALYAAFLDAIPRWCMKKWILLVAVAAFLNSALALMQYAGWDPLFYSMDPDFHSSYRRYRLAGFMDSPNMLVPFIASVVPFFFARWITGKTTRDFLIYGFILAFLLAPIALSQNLAGWLGLFPVIFILMVYFSLRARSVRSAISTKKLLSCWVAALVIVVTGIYMYASQDKESKIIKGYSLNERLTQNRAAWMMLADSPITGKGPNFFYSHFVEYRRAVWINNPPPSLPLRTAHQVHNEYIQLLAEGGLLTAIPLAMLLLYWLFAHLRFLRGRIGRDGFTHGEILFIGAAGGFWSIMINAVANFPFHVEPLAVTALFWAAAAHRMIQYGKNDKLKDSM